MASGWLRPRLPRQPETSSLDGAWRIIPSTGRDDQNPSTLARIGMNVSPPPQLRRVGPPKALKWIVAGLCFLGGPGLIAFGSTELIRRHDELTATATATVVDIKVRNGSDSKLHCAILEWQHEGQAVRTEAAECDRISDARTVGETIPIRYSPDDLETPFVDSFMGVYGMAIPLGIAGIFFTVAFLFLVLPRPKRSKPPA
jgi:hypothetical protein